jgi:opacity protein-like surface antigen
MKNLRQSIRCLLTCATLAASALPAMAAATIPIYDNGQPDHQDANNMGYAWQAEDFTLGSGQWPSSVTFWSLENHDATDPYRGSISWSILSAPGGTILASGTTSDVTRTLSPTQYLGLSEYRNQFDIGSMLNLSAGTYWLVLHNGAFSNLDDPNEFLWETAASNGSATGMESYDLGATWIANGNQHAFLISAVPEPASVAMLAGGLLLAGCLRRREQASDRFETPAE